MPKTIQIGDEQFYTVRPPKWRYILIGLIGVIVGMYYGVSFLGLMLVLLAYYIRTALTISIEGLSSLTMLILVIIVLVMLKKKFENAFSYVLTFLIAMLIGIAIMTFLVLNGHTLEPPVPIPNAPEPYDPNADNSTTPLNYTATVIHSVPLLSYHLFGMTSTPLGFLSLFLVGLARTKNPIRQLEKTITNPNRTRLQLALLLAFGMLVIGISTSILSSRLVNIINQFVDINSPIFLITMFGLLVFGVYIFRLSLKI